MSRDPIIAPEGAAWEEPAAMADDVARLEADLGETLPQDFRNFLLTFNGGAPYPLIFDFPPDEDEPMRFLDRLNRAGRILELRSGTTFGAGPPPDVLMIGEDPGGLIVLMSLQPRTLGSIYGWYGTSEPWGAANNGPEGIVPLAPDFRSFLAGLYETDDMMAWEHWSTPQRRALQRPLVLP